MTRVSTLVAATVAALVLTACGGGTDSSTGSDSSAKATGSTGAASRTPEQKDFNPADVDFVVGMIPHHEQALQMAEMATKTATSPDVRRLAAAITKSQAPEIDTMAGWLRAWGQDAAMPGHGSDADMGPGMMDEKGMAGLEAAHGQAFDRMWLEAMVAHHKGAITMAGTEVAKGRNGAAKELATRIAADQQREVTEMERLLAKG